MSPIEILQRAIQSGALLGSETFKYLDVERVLHGRDEPIFEEQWLRLFDRVRDVALNEDELHDLEALRMAAFKTTFAHSSDPDLSADVSDDFEVMAKAIAHDSEQDFLLALVETYCGGNIPHGLIKPSGRNIQSLLESLEI
jgi:hypothetical protein